MTRLEFLGHVAVVADVHGLSYYADATLWRRLRLPLVPLTTHSEKGDAIAFNSRPQSPRRGKNLGTRCM